METVDDIRAYGRCGQVANPRNRAVSQLPSSILDCVGNTPLVKMDHLSSRADLTVLGKLEMQNPGGSIKDRTAVSMLRTGMATGNVSMRSKIVESSSGNLAIGLAQACRIFGLPLTVVVDTRTNSDVVRLVRLYGADIEVVTETRAGETLLDARLRRVQELSESDPDTVWINQYENPANPTAHHATMNEVIEQTGGEFDRMYVATSTCGTLVGCREALKMTNLSPTLVAVDAAGSAIFQPKGDASQIERHIPGHGSSRKSSFLEEKDFDKVSLVSDRECVEGCRHLLSKEGILAGGSSGGVVSAFRREEDSLPFGSTVVLILCDRGERYLDTVYNDEWVEETLPKA